jgi:HipA-like protein
MRQGKVYNNEVLAGIISQTDDGMYTFEYDAAYCLNVNLPSISLTLPKAKQVFHSSILFPFFFNLLSEGSNKKIQSQLLKIDEEDYFGFLLKTTAHETIGAIRVEEI